MAAINDFVDSAHEPVPGLPPTSYHQAMAAPGIWSLPADVAPSSRHVGSIYLFIMGKIER
ncbi:hypothetical protein [Arthrobacter sp. D1-17]